MSYENFAFYYDSLMDNKFYNDYYRFINNHAKFQAVLELGCGTGSMAIKMARAKKEVYATDLSDEMLEVARLKAMEANVDLMLRKIDMRDFEVGFQVDLVTCLCDSLNYIIDKNEVFQVFNNVHNSLKQDGTFIFDVNSIYKVEHVINDYHEAESDDEFDFNWDTKYLGDGLVEHFVKILNKETGELVNEHHIQKTFPVETYRELLEKAGFGDIELYSDFQEYQPECQRVIFVARKGAKI